MIPEANGQRGTGLGPRRQQVLDGIPLASLGWSGPFENWPAWLPVLLSLLQVADLLPRFHAEHMGLCSSKGLCN